MSLQMNELIDMLKQGVQPIIRITDTIFFDLAKEINCFFVDNGQMARIISISPSEEEGCFSVTIDQTGFLDSNLKLEVPAYWDKTSKTYSLTHEEFYKRKPNLIENQYWCIDENGVDGIEILAEGSRGLTLFNRYKAACSELSYVQWLEELVGNLDNSKGLESLNE